MTRIRCGAIGVLLVLSACGGDKEPTLPAATLLSPEGVNHIQSRFSPDGGKVAYWAPGGDGWDLVVANADLSSPRVVSSHNTRTWEVIWSPDSRRFTTGASATNVADIVVFPVDSGEAKQLTSGAGFEVPTSWSPRGDRLTYSGVVEGGVGAAFFLDLGTGASSRISITAPVPIARWSPDGTRLSVDGFGGRPGKIWVADSAGGNETPVTTEGLESQARWSPDGTEIAYVSRRTGRGDIWVAPVNGGAPRQLTHDIREDNSPRWSPDGKYIAFVSQRGQQTDLWVVPAAGGTEIRVTDDISEEGNPQWVGNTMRIAYHTGISGQAAWSISVADGTERQLTPDSIQVAEINPSPDGSTLAYEVLRGGGVSDLMLMPVACGPSRTLVANGALNNIPNWSPDGKFITFVSTRAGNPDIWIVAAAGGEARQLTEFSSVEANPQWSPDGSFVYFTTPHEASPFSDLWKVPAAGGAPVRITRTGTVNGLAVSLVSSDIFVQAEGGKGGRTVLARVLPDGKLQTVWDRSNLTGYSWFGFSPKGDSLAINAELPDGGVGSYLISTKTGQGRQLLARNDQIGDFSPDGRWLGYWMGTATLELGVVDMKDGTSRQLTKSPESETSYWWTADNNTLLFTRQSQRRRIAEVDLTELLARTKP